MFGSYVNSKSISCNYIGPYDQTTVVIIILMSYEYLVWLQQQSKFDLESHYCLLISFKFKEINFIP